MGAWGYGPFDNDDAGDMAAGLMEKVRKVAEGKREYGYFEARAAAQFVVLAHGTDILGGPDISLVVKALARMRTDVGFLMGCREPQKWADAINKELRDVLGRMRACKGCRRRYRMPEHKGEWGELEAMARAAIESPVPKSEIPSRRVMLGKLRSRARLKSASPARQKKKRNYRHPRKLGR